MTRPLSNDYLNRIEASIDEMGYTGGDVQRLVNEIRRQRAVQNSELREALQYLDAIIAAYKADERGSLVVACQLATQWRNIESLKDQWYERLPGDNHANRSA